LDRPWRAHAAIRSSVPAVFYSRRLLITARSARARHHPAVCIWDVTQPCFSAVLLGLCHPPNTRNEREWAMASLRLSIRWARAGRTSGPRRVVDSALPNSGSVGLCVGPRQVTRSYSRICDWRRKKPKRLQKSRTLPLEFQRVQSVSGRRSSQWCCGCLGADFASLSSIAGSGLATAFRTLPDPANWWPQFEQVCIAIGE
jgi:hypothetical protein